MCYMNKRTVSEDVRLEDVATPTILHELPVIQLHGFRVCLVIEGH